MQGWRKAYGAIKDSTTVSLANLNSDFKVALDPLPSPPISPGFFRPKFGQFIQTLVSPSAKRARGVFGCGSSLGSVGFDWCLVPFVGSGCGDREGD